MERKRKREELKEARTTRAKQEKGSRELVNLASKAITSVQPALTKLENAEKSIAKCRDKIEDITIEQLDESLKWCKDVLTEAHAIMKKVGSGGLALDSEYTVIRSVKSLGLKSRRATLSPKQLQ